MTDVRYVVELDITRAGDFGIESLDGKLKRTQGSVDKFKKGWSDVSSAVAPVGYAIDSVVSKVASFAKYAAVGAGAAIFAGATYGVMHLNNELEQAQISLGAIFNANGMAAGVPAGMVMAKGLIQQMRVDAQKLPGEFEDLMEIFKTGAIPAFQAGASVQQFRGMSGQAMAAGKVMGLQNDMVAREFAQLLSGRAGAHNVFGTRLGFSGDSAQKLNKEAPDARLKDVTAALGKYAGAIDAFASTFDTQSSTLIDNFKIYGAKATSSLFIHVKDAMADANDWFSKHQEQAEAFAVTWGSRLVEGFETGKSVLSEYGPLVLEFTEGAYQKFMKIWVDVQPYVHQFDTALKAALADPNGTIDKLIHLAELWAAMKGLGFLGSGVSGALASGGAKGAAGQLAMTGGTMLAGYGVAHAATSGPSMESHVETVGGFTMLGSKFGTLGAAAGAVAGSLVGLYQAYQAHTTEQQSEWDRMLAGTDDLITQQMAQGVSAEKIGYALQKNADDIRAAGDGTAAALLEKAAQIRMADFTLEKHATDRMNDIGSWWGIPKTTVPSTAYGDTNASHPDPNALKHKGGGGGTIQKVEIVVTSNQNPSRIARAVVGHIGRLQRNPGASPDVKNFSSLEDY